MDSHALPGSTSAIHQSLNTATENCSITYQPLRYGIKFKNDSNWYEINSAWRWLVDQPRDNKNKSPYTRTPWLEIEKIQEFSFAESISDYDSHSLIAEIRAQIRVKGRLENIRGFIFSEMTALNRGYTQYLELERQGDENILSIGQASPDAAPFVYALSQTQTARMMAAPLLWVGNLRANSIFATTPFPTIMTPENQGEPGSFRSGCWSCIKRVASKFFARAAAVQQPHEPAAIGIRRR